MRAMLLPITVFVGTLTVAAWADSDEAGRKSAAAVTAAEIAAFANHLALRPETAIDFSKVSGEYCFNLGLAEGGHMTHYAIDPAKSQEDVIDSVDARPYDCGRCELRWVTENARKTGKHDAKSVVLPSRWTI